MADKLTLRYTALDEVELWKRNPRRHDIPSIKASMRRFGFTVPVLFDSGTERIVAGHGRIEALSQLRSDGEPAPDRIRVRAKDKVWMLPVVYGVHFDTKDEAIAYLVADNQISDISGWDADGLGDILRQLDKTEMDLLDSMGFNQETLRDALAGGVNWDDFSKDEKAPIEAAPMATPKDGSWFYVEYYGEPERYNRLRLLLQGDSTQHCLDADQFETIVLAHYGEKHAKV